MVLGSVNGEPGISETKDISNVSARLRHKKVGNG